MYKQKLETLLYETIDSSLQTFIFQEMYFSLTITHTEKDFLEFL